MENKETATVNITINGGTNQIMPNATKAEQHFHYTQASPTISAPTNQPHPWLRDDELRLSLYIEKEERLQAYIATLAACASAEQVGEVVVRMCADEPKITSDLATKEKFITLLLPFLTGMEKGKSIDNLRLNINDAWAAYKKNRREKGL